MRTTRLVTAAIAVWMCATAAAAQTRAFAVVKDVDYVPQIEYPGGKDRLDVAPGARTDPHERVDADERESNRGNVDAHPAFCVARARSEVTGYD